MGAEKNGKMDKKEQHMKGEEWGEMREKQEEEKGRGKETGEMKGKKKRGGEEDPF